MCVRMRKELNEAAIEGFLPGYDLRRVEDVSLCCVVICSVLSA